MSEIIVLSTKQSGVSNFRLDQTMAAKNMIYLILIVLLSILFYNPCEAIKCFQCNSANNSACLDLHMQKMNAIVPVVDCANSVPSSISKEFFCRKITQTILHAEKSPEVRVTRSCGWVKSKRECYTNDNKDHLEIVCQCFGDMCNSATAVGAGVATLVASAIFVTFRS